MGTKVYTPGEMEEAMRAALKGSLATATVALTFKSEVLGGLPASENGIRAFVTHHLHLVGEGADEAVQRILTQEVRKDTTKPGDEVAEIESYAVNVLPRMESGIPFIGTWQVRAMIKQCASRLGLLMAKRGAKGDISEGMWVHPRGASKLGTFREIGIIGPDGKPFSQRLYRKVMGNVGTPSGRASIVSDREYAPIGSHIEFTLQWPAGKLTTDDMAAV